MENLNEVYNLFRAGKCVIIDVREEHELKESGIVEGATWTPTSQLTDAAAWSKFKETLPRDKEIYIYCRSGARSGRVVEILQADGYPTKNLGGLKDWLAANLPIRAFP